MTCEHNCPPSWPENWTKEYSATLRQIQTPTGRSHLFNGAIRHIAYCNARGEEFLSCDAILAHRDSMRRELSRCVANAYANKLVLVARKRDDKILRDDLLECFRDMRSASEILMARHVPGLCGHWVSVPCSAARLHFRASRLWIIISGWSIGWVHFRRWQPTYAPRLASSAWREISMRRTGGASGSHGRYVSAGIAGRQHAAGGHQIVETGWTSGRSTATSRRS